MARKKKAAEDYKPLVEGLKLNGFVVTEEVVAAWNADQIAMVRECLTEWDIYTPGRARTEIPEWLTEFDMPGDPAILEAKTVGAEWRKLNMEGDADAANPWPFCSQLFYGWSDGATFGVHEPDADLPDQEYNIVVESETAAVVATSEDSVAVSTGNGYGFTVAAGETITIEEAISRASEAMSAKKSNRLTCSKRDKAVLSIVQKLGKVTPACNEAQLKYQGAHQIATKLKKEWEALQLQMQGICTQLAEVANGADYQPDLFDDAEIEPHRPPHAEVHQEGGGVASRPAQVLAVDTGGNLDLNCLSRKALAAIGSDAEGLPPGKIDALRSACEGDTIAKLELMQRTNSSWNRDIKNFGDKWIDRLQDAHSAVRTHYPMPVESYEPAPESLAEKANALGDAVDDAVEIQAELIESGELVAVGDDGFGEDMPE